MKAILSIDSRGAIGVDSELAITHPDDFKHFQNITKGMKMVCGFGTLHQVKNLHGTLSREVILHTEREIPETLNTELQNKGIKVLTKNEVLELKNVIIIGGLKTYKAFRHYTKEVFLTRFSTFNPKANKFMNFKEVYPSFIKEKETKHQDFTIFHLKRT